MLSHTQKYRKCCPFPAAKQNGWGAKWRLVCAAGVATIIEDFFYFALNRPHTFNNV